jgi:2-methylcitrate dehydratase PrpD
MPAPELRNDTPEQALAGAAAQLTWEQLPPEAIEAAQRLFLDWLGSAIGGSGSAQVTRLARATARGGLADMHRRDEDSAATATALAQLSQAPPLLAALLNGAASHVLEMDDLDNESIYHPGTCIFPAALAVAEAEGVGPREFLTASVAGYEVSLRIGQALGPEHYRYFHTTGTAGTFGAAVATGRLIGLDAEGMLSALGNAGTQAAGLWQFLSDGTMSKQLHAAKAAFNGVLSALLASEGFTGTSEVLLGEKGLLRATTDLPGDAAVGGETLAGRQRRQLMEGLEEGSGEGGRGHRFVAFKIPGVSIKYHASCRHTHPAVDALLLLMGEQELGANDILAIRAYVNSAAFDLLKDVVPSSPWAAKFSLQFCLAQAAVTGRLQVDSFTESALAESRVVELMKRITLELDRSLDDGYPRRWAAAVEVDTSGGVSLRRQVDAPKGDPNNPLSAEELEAKFRTLATIRLNNESAQRMMGRLRRLTDLDSMAELLQDVETAVQAPGALVGGAIVLP